MTEPESEAEKARRTEIEDLLVRTRKTIAESRAMVDQAHLRMAETDRLLASQGLTREQVMNMSFSREQILAVNEELARRGLPPLETDDAAFDFAAATDDLREDDTTVSAVSGENDVIAERSRKFSNLMQTYRI